ncbi:beta-ketoacyl-[acyl-carrier-protein] synthase II [Alphaproteobacteria bacterium]|nr:beta-ketoacyl-[acyl-carrier-protein] synthase II [Alphaproteobacteria bacterium]
MIYFSAAGMVNALGRSLDEISENLVCGRAPGMKDRPAWLQSGSPCRLGGVDGDLPEIPDGFARHRSRNNRLLLAALEPVRSKVDEAIARCGEDRVAIVLGTSTSGLDEADQQASSLLNGKGPVPSYDYYQQELGDPSRFLAALLGLSGPSYTISTACSSSARAIISGRRLIESGMADAALVGGADTLSRMTVNGFDSLEALSPTLCQPFCRDRDGITIGEGAALMLLSREPQPVALLGVGESSDAWHMSAPHPEGKGAARAIAAALQDAKLAPDDIGYVNLHGTGTRLNDQVEALVMNRAFEGRVPCSSTKYLTGHMLGAAGAGEALLCWLLLTRDLPLPKQDFSRSPPDETLPDCGLLHSPAGLKKKNILSSSFGFGGNNACLILGLRE